VRVEVGSTDQLLAGAFVVVPAYNEAQVIRGVILELLQSFPNVVVVNDGSSDGTAAALSDTGARVVTHLINLGQGAALQTGITFALEHGASCVVTFDADGQHRVEDAVASVRMLHEGGCDVVCGSRFLGTSSNIPGMRRIVLKAAAAWSNLVSRTKMTDAHNGLRALSRDAAASLNLSQSGMAHASQIVTQLQKKHMRICEVPVQIRYTAYSLSKGQSLANSVNILADLFIERFVR